MTCWLKGNCRDEVHVVAVGCLTTGSLFLGLSPRISLGAEQACTACNGIFLFPKGCVKPNNLTNFDLYVLLIVACKRFTGHNLRPFAFEPSLLVARALYVPWYYRHRSLIYRRCNFPFFFLSFCFFNSNWICKSSFLLF